MEIPFLSLRKTQENDSYADIARNISNCGQADFNRAMRIARTEGHRVQNEAKLDTYKNIKKKGADIVKQWDATLDGKTRKSHQKLDGQIRELDEDFEIGGKSAPCPGKFNDPSEDCHCRCAMLQRARWALDEDELKTLQERAEYFGLDKSESFADFKEKYVNAVANSGESGIINLEEDPDENQAKFLYNTLSREERIEVIEKGRNAKQPIFSYDREDNKAMSFLQRTPKKENTFDVMAHGSPTSIEFFKQDYPDGDKRANIDAYTLSVIMRGRNDYTKFIAECKKNGVDPVIRMLSCNTGDTTNTGNCFAQLLANELGVKVEAPTDTLLVKPDGTFYIGRKKDGKMKIFYARK